MSSALDIIHIDSDYSVAICKVCRSAFQTTISQHIRSHHNKTPRRSKAEIDAYATPLSIQEANSSANQIRRIRPPCDAPPVAFLRVYNKYHYIRLI